MSDLPKDLPVSGGRPIYRDVTEGKNDIHPPPAEFTQQQLVDDPILRFFHYAHLPDALRVRSQPFAALAMTLVTGTPRNAERTVALRKLLEAKDAAVRAAL